MHLLWTVDQARWTDRPTDWQTHRHVCCRLTYFWLAVVKEKEKEKRLLLILLPLASSWFWVLFQFSSSLLFFLFLPREEKKPWKKIDVSGWLAFFFLNTKLKDILLSFCCQSTRYHVKSVEFAGWQSILYQLPFKAVIFSSFEPPPLVWSLHWLKSYRQWTGKKKFASRKITFTWFLILTGKPMLIQLHICARW